jgi:4-amino-4-deoxy-L-arabinose transferase-like glycosyltransferase
MSADSRLRNIPALVGIVALYLTLALPTIDRQGIHWDEQTDLEIAESYFVSLGAPLRGSNADLVNVRLPMFSVAALQLVGAPLNLRTARVASVLVGALTLIGVFVFARIELDDRRGLLAALLLAVNPYFLAFAPLAFTEGDVFITCSATWALATFAWLWQRPVRVRALAAGIALGLALSSKFSALSLIPALTMATWLRDDRRKRGSELLRDARPWIGVGLILCAWIGFQAIATGSVLPDLRTWIPEPPRASLTRLALIFALLLAMASWSLRRPFASMSTAATLIQPVILAVATFFIIPPSHTTNGAIFSSLWRETLEAGGGFDIGLAVEIGLLHLSVLWIKPSLGIGTALIVGAGVALMRWRERPELRAPLLVIACYGGFLLSLPWGQVRHAMPLLPPLVLLASDALVGLLKRRLRLGVTAAATMATLCAVDIMLCYPDLNLNGHQWLGTRYWGGRSTLGYRSIGHVGNDGIEQCTRWVAEHATAGESIATYSIARHIVDRTRPEGSDLRWIDGTLDRDALMDADWVITHLNDDIDAGYGLDDSSGEVFAYPLYDRRALMSNFEKVYTIERRFGIEVASVWRRL